MMVKIVLTGPESSGKTTLSRWLAAHFGTDCTPEFARHYLHTLGRPYVEDDLLRIAEGQILLENELMKQPGDLLFCDTSLEVVKIWSEVRFGRCHPWILEKYDQRQPDLYLLCYPDLPWEADPLRENPDDRHTLLEKYRKELTGRKAPVKDVQGTGETRLQNAVNIVNDFYNKMNIKTLCRKK